MDEATQTQLKELCQQAGQKIEAKFWEKVEESKKKLIEKIKV